jgi:hypothetical protein
VKKGERGEGLRLVVKVKDELRLKHRVIKVL